MTDNPDREFEKWYTEFYPNLLTSLRLGFVDADVAKHAADEALVRSYENWDRIRRMDSPNGWTYRVAYNIARRRCWRAKLERTLLAGKREELVSAPAGEIWQVVRKLPERQRQAVTLRHIAQLSEPDIAKAMGIKRGTVSATLRQAYKSLRVELSDEFNPTEVMT